MILRAVKYLGDVLPPALICVSCDKDISKIPPDPEQGSGKIVISSSQPGYNAYVNNQMWVESDNAEVMDIPGAWCFITKKTRGKVNLDFAVINDIVVDFQNTWVATNNGLYKLNNRSVITEHFTTENSPLPSNNVYDLVSDNSVNPRMATGRGVVRFQIN